VTSSASNAHLIGQKTNASFEKCFELQACEFPCYNVGTIQVVISRFRRDVDENCALLGYNAASSGNTLQTFWGNL
jgi:hypothetical protein